MTGQALPRRALDIAGSLVALGLSAPLWPAIALAVRLSSPGPLLHRAVRVGRAGRPVTIHKFRSMVTGEPGAPVTAADDPRVTRAGRILRRTKLDELPQLIDVLGGSLALVGPRPEDPVYVEGYGADERDLLLHRPGLFSPATIAFRDEESILAAAPDPQTAYRTVVLPRKISIDLEYFARRSVVRDLRVLAAGLVAVVRPERADALCRWLLGHEIVGDLP